MNGINNYIFIKIEQDKELEDGRLLLLFHPKQNAICMKMRAERMYALTLH